MAKSGRVDFFVSYTQVDRAWAEWIAWQLEHVGYTTRLQAWDFQPGTNFVTEMHRAASDSERTIAILSKAYLASGFTQAEWAAAFARDPTGRERRLVPVRVRECDLAGLLPQIVHIDLVGVGNDEDARDRLLAGVEQTRAKPLSEPPFPGRGEAERPPLFPGPVPGFWSVPSPTRAFTGRERLIADIAEQAASDRHGRPVIQVLHGLGGVGKTQIAAHFANAHRDAYDVVWWVRASNELLRRADLAQLAVELRLAPAEVQDEVVTIAALMRWLSDHERWLLIFDDAPGPDAVAELLPVNGSGHVLITSRQASGWRNLATPHAVESWTRAESVAFLSRRTGRSPDADAERLAVILGDLPLALEQAGAYIDAVGIGFGAYHRRMREQASTLLTLQAPRGYDASVATTWTLAFEELGSEPHARHLLHICAVMAADPIPESLFETLFPGVLIRDQAIEAALRFSLVTARDSTIVMHPLVQQVALLRMSESERVGAMADAVRALAATFPQRAMEPGTWPLCLSLIPHVVRLMVAELGAEAHVHVWLLIQRLATFHGARGELELALPLLVDVSETIEEALGPDAEELVQPWSHIGFILAQLGDVERGMAYAERALAIAEKNWEPDDERLGMLLDGIGNVCDLAGDIDEAIRFRQCALEIYERCAPPPASLAGALSNLGGSYLIIRKLDAARLQYERAIAVLEEVDEPHPIAYSHALGGLADVCDASGEYEAATLHHERSIGLLERALSADNILIASARVNFCWTLLGLEDWARARAEASKATQALDGKLPEGHPTDVRLRRIRAAIAYAEGDHSTALEHLKSAMAMTSDTDSTARRFQLTWMAWISDETGRTGEAVEYQQRLLALARDVWA